MGINYPNLPLYGDKFESVKGQGKTFPDGSRDNLLSGLPTAGGTTAMADKWV